MQAEAARVIAIMGGKFPHFMTSIPGGTAWVPTEEKLDDILFRLMRVRDFVYNTMIPDTLAIAPFYTDALSYGGGHGNFLAWGVFNGESMEMKNRYLPNGAVFAGSLKADDADPAKITEYVKHSWFEPAGRRSEPRRGQDEPRRSPSTTSTSKYTWAKAPRYDGKPMEVGPLVAHARRVSATACKPVKAIVDVALAKLGRRRQARGPRLAARPHRGPQPRDRGRRRLGDRVGQRAHRRRQGRRREVLRADPTPSAGDGAGMWEAPRGALGHWMNVSGGRIANYQVCTPSTWDISPRDDQGVTRCRWRRPSSALPCIDTEKPMEAARIVRSFDP